MAASGGFVTDLGRPDLHVSERHRREVHVVPLGDAMDHYVPGGYDDHPYRGPDESFAHAWLTIEADLDQHSPGASCGCFPSVEPHGSGRVVIHHARDGRASGNYGAER